MAPEIIMGTLLSQGALDVTGGRRTDSVDLLLCCVMCGKIYIALIKSMIFKNIFLLVTLPGYYNQDSGTQDWEKEDKQQPLQNVFY